MKSENIEQIKPSASPNQLVPNPLLGTMLVPHESALGWAPAGPHFGGLGQILSHILGCDSVNWPVIETSKKLLICVWLLLEKLSTISSNSYGIKSNIINMYF